MYLKYLLFTSFYFIVIQTAFVRVYIIYFMENSRTIETLLVQNFISLILGQARQFLKLINYMNMDRIQQICGVTGLFLALYHLKLDSQQFLQLNKIRKAVERAKIVTQSQNIQQEGSIVLLKTSCKYSFTVEHPISIGSNNILFNYLPIDFYFSKVNHLINQQKINKRINWMDQSGIIRRVPQILDTNMLSFKIKYTGIFDEKNPPGFFLSVAKYLLATLAAFGQMFFVVLDSQRRKQQVSFRRMTIEGPHWGTLQLVASLATNVPFVLCCKIKDGKLIPEYAGLTKDIILQYFQTEEHISLFRMALQMLFVLYFGRAVIRRHGRRIKQSLKQLFSFFKKSVKKDIHIQKTLDIEIDDENSCIICYDKCRNIIFGNCKHLIVCKRCYEDERNPIDLCPYCRVDVGEIRQIKECRPVIVRQRFD